MKYQVIFDQNGEILSYADAAVNLKDDDGNPVAFGPVTTDGQQASVVEIKKEKKAGRDKTLFDQYRVNISGKAPSLRKLREKK